MDNEISDDIISAVSKDEKERAKSIPKPTDDELRHVGEEMARMERELFDVIMSYNLPPGFVMGVLEKLKQRVYDNRLMELQSRNAENMMKKFAPLFNRLFKTEK